MPKYQARAELRKHFPECFSVDNKQNRVWEINVVVSDAQIDWYRFAGRPQTSLATQLAIRDELAAGEVAEGVSRLDRAINEWIIVERPPVDEYGTAVGWDLLVHMLRPIIGAFLFGRTHTWVLRFDKAAYVPPSKANIRAERAKAASKSKIVPFEWDGTSRIVDIDLPLPPWASLNANRRARNRALKECCELIMLYFRHRAVGREFIIDGYDATSAKPHSIRYMGPSIGYMTHQTSFGENKIGEADHALPFFAKLYQCAHGWSTLTRSRDTDITWLDLLHADPDVIKNRFLHCPARRYFRIDDGTELTSVAARALDRKEYRAVDEIIDVVKLRAAIHARLSPHLSRPIQSFVVGASAAVSDYVIGFPGVTLARFIDAMLAHADFIGDLVVEQSSSGSGIVVDRHAYGRLLDTAYALKWQCTALLNRKTQYRDELREWVAAHNKSPKRATWHMPDDIAIHWRHLHTQWYALYMILGPIDPDLVPDPSTMGYRAQMSADGKLQFFPVDFTTPLPATTATSAGDDASVVRQGSRAHRQ